MKIKETKITKMSISEVSMLSTITVFLEPNGDNAGKITFECGGVTGSAYFGSTGIEFRKFIAQVSADYLTGKTHTGDHYEVDYDAINQATGQQFSHECELLEYSELLEAVYGLDWCMDLPQIETREYVQCYQICEAIIEGVKKSQINS